MKIRTQSTLTVVLFGITFIIVAVLLFITHQHGERLDRQAGIAGSIEQITRDLSFLSSSLLLHGETYQRLRFEAKVSSLAPFLSNLKPESPDQHVLVENIKGNEAGLKEIYGDVKSTLGSKSGALDPANRLSFLQVSWSRMQVQIQGMISDASRLSQALNLQEKQVTQRSTVLVLVLVGLFVTYFFFNFLLTSRRVLQSISELQAGTEIIGSGNLDYAIPVKHRDEVGELSDSFNRMVTSLKELTASKAELEREIADRKRAEEALRESEERFRLSMEATNDGLWDWNAVTDEVYYSPSYYRILGHEPGGFPATLQAWKERLHPEDLEHTVQVNMDCVEGGTESFAVEYRMKAKNGEWQWILGRGKCITRDAQGRAIRLIGTHVEITERKQAEEQIQQQVKDLQAVNEELARFNRAAVGRELRMIELKKEVNGLAVRLGEPTPYKGDGEEK